MRRHKKVPSLHWLVNEISRNFAKFPFTTRRLYFYAKFDLATRNWAKAIILLFVAKVSFASRALAKYIFLREFSFRNKKFRESYRCLWNFVYHIVSTHQGCMIASLEHILYINRVYYFCNHLYHIDYVVK
jgi:hypothetical protein